jgi:hypothetical protein
VFSGFIACSSSTGYASKLQLEPELNLSWIEHVARRLEARNQRGVQIGAAFQLVERLGCVLETSDKPQVCRAFSETGETNLLPGFYNLALE